MDGTILQQGRFTATGNRITLAIRSDVDWMYIYNETAIAQAAADLGAVFYWQRGMTQGRGIVTTKLGTIANDPTTIGQIATLAGFTLINQGTDALISGATAFTAISDATQPIVSTGSTAGLVAGDVVRLSMTTAQFSANPSDVLAIDFQIDTIVANTSFRLASTLATTPGAVAGAGSWRRVSLSSPFYPETRYVVNITQAVNAVVTTSVDHDYLAGQKIRFHVDTVANVNGMVEINNLIGTITAVTANTFTVDIDTTAFTAFTFPTVAQVAALSNAYTPAYVGPLGENTAFALANNLDTLADATVNISIIGMQLAAGTLSPAGQNNDVIYWVAGKSYLVDNGGDLVV